MQRAPGGYAATAQGHAAPLLQWPAGPPAASVLNWGTPGAPPGSWPGGQAAPWQATTAAYLAAQQEQPQLLLLRQQHSGTGQELDFGVTSGSGDLDAMASANTEAESSLLQHGEAGQQGQQEQEQLQGAFAPGDGAPQAFAPVLQQGGATAPVQQPAPEQQQLAYQQQVAYQQFALQQQLAYHQQLALQQQQQQLGMMQDQGPYAHLPALPGQYMAAAPPLAPGWPAAPAPGRGALYVAAPGGGLVAFAPAFAISPPDRSPPRRGPRAAVAAAGSRGHGADQLPPLAAGAGSPGSPSAGAAAVLRAPPRVEYDRAPRPVPSFKPYTHRDLLARGFDPKSAPYYQLGPLGPDYELHEEWRAAAQKAERQRGFGLAASAQNRERLAALTREPTARPRKLSTRERALQFAKSVPRPRAAPQQEAPQPEQALPKRTSSLPADNQRLAAAIRTELVDALGGRGAAAHGAAEQSAQPQASAWGTLLGAAQAGSADVISETAGLSEQGECDDGEERAPQPEQPEQAASFESLLAAAAAPAEEEEGHCPQEEASEAASLPESQPCIASDLAPEGAADEEHEPPAGSNAAQEEALPASQAGPPACRTEEEQAPQAADGMVDEAKPQLPAEETTDIPRADEGTGPAEEEEVSEEAEEAAQWVYQDAEAAEPTDAAEGTHVADEASATESETGCQSAEPEAATAEQPQTEQQAGEPEEAEAVTEQPQTEQQAGMPEEAEAEAFGTEHLETEQRPGEEQGEAEEPAASESSSQEEEESAEPAGSLSNSQEAGETTELPTIEPRSGEASETTEAAGSEPFSQQPGEVLPRASQAGSANEPVAASGEVSSFEQPEDVLAGGQAEGEIASE